MGLTGAPTGAGAFFGRWGWQGLDDPLYTARCGTCGRTELIPNYDIVTSEEAVRIFSVHNWRIEDAQIRCPDCT